MSIAAVTVKLVERREPAPPPETLLRRRVRAERVAVGLVREWPHGHELVVMVDDVLRYGRLYRTDPAALQADSDAKLQQLEAVGWTAE